ncbi:phosphodiester glycosidase family protein [Streptomyces sp. ME02-8801-2C]|uniref:phosphodiester glycosidase family protein n=1 Tax=Streptomyces sp. ME02-8801-2C TaxID=3028680 RepID=UPI0029A949BD|nr:phosphodiester glycosidase family protein [Streptomyces sp. ME02-8801-2C]MDX3452798.1 phosphodiester glycosidase family protein [Streptomyces sp. ME02-8801-2C]
MRGSGRFGTGRSAVSAVAVIATVAGATLTGAAPAGGASRAAGIAPGVRYAQFDIRAAKGTTHAHLLSVDLGHARVRVNLLHPGAVAARAAVSRMSDAHGAVAAVNGDFFNISETQHPGVAATGAPVGPAIASGAVLKAAVPNGQRFGPSMPPGVTTTAVLGVGTDRRARLDNLALSGSVSTPVGSFSLGGLNQYALPVGSVGAFTQAWGSVSRERAVCGTDTDRAAPCGTDAYEVTVRRGRVVRMTESAGSGAIAADTTVLLGREAGARQLRKLFVGAKVKIKSRLVAARSRVPYRFALGGYPVLRDGRPLAGLDTSTSAVRTAVGIADGGRRLLLLAVDGAPDHRSGLTASEVASTMRKLGSVDAFNLDGGGSTTLVARAPGANRVTVRNHPTGGAERPVPNAIGVFLTS